MSQTTKPIRKLLIANRGEIAVRVIRAAREMGIRAVAIYSEADRHQMHVSMADEAVFLGADDPGAGYLDMARIIEIGREVTADAIHPGYGFLSERAEFSQACSDSGIVFIGPPASAMHCLGSKIEAKQLAVSLGVPITPGFFQQDATLAQLKEAASQIGCPVLLKASAGGGGRGMRVVLDLNAFEDEFSIASDEALKAFGNGEMMVEKLVERPRHIEVQVLADAFGNVACLFERDCSIQRRHQKLIEESPSPAISDDLWQRLKTAARALILGAGYVGAGTVEFMFDEPADQIYFLEVNARLQVEHPVTEMISGLDLVQWQIRIAAGEKLGIADGLLDGDRSFISGHAIEARIVAEDPSANFMPSIGRILAWAEPKRPGVRVDTGCGGGSEITRHYDSLIAKVIAHGETRESAIAKLEAALLDFHILGVKTNIAYILEVIRHPDFQSGRFDTGFLGREFHDWHSKSGIPIEVFDLSNAAITSVGTPGAGPQQAAVWDLADQFRLARP